MKMVLLLTIVILSTPIICCADEFYIEDKALSPIPSGAEAAIRQLESGFKKCKFMGKHIDLDGDKKSEDLVVTTQNGCEWGAALGPIWVLREVKGSYFLLLDYGGYNLVVNKSKHNGLRDITISAGTAGWSEESRWRFDGRRYIKYEELNKISDE